VQLAAGFFIGPFPIDDLLQSSSRFVLHLGYQSVRHQNQGLVTASCAGSKELSESSMVDELTHQGKAVMIGQPKNVPAYKT
jgi:hypothetical protein